MRMHHRNHKYFVPKSYENIAEGSKQKVISTLACSNFPREARLITFAEEIREPKIKFWTLTSQAKMEQPTAKNL